MLGICFVINTSKHLMFQSESRIHPEIKYVDVKESSTDVYLRTTTPDIAQQLLATKHWPNMDLLQGNHYF